MGDQRLDPISEALEQVGMFKIPDDQLPEKWTSWVAPDEWRNREDRECFEDHPLVRRD